MSRLDLSRLDPAYAADLLTRAIASVERAPSVPPRALIAKAGLVEGQFALDHALPRYLVWRAYLRSQVPTPASIAHALQHAQSYARWWAVLRLLDAGSVPPQPIPARLRSWPTSAQRADLPDDTTPVDPGADGAIGPSTGDTSALDGDAAFFDQPWVQDYLTNADQDTVAQGVPRDAAQPIIDSVGRELSYYSWLEGSFLSDMQVLQLLDGFFNTRAATAAGQQFLDAAGLVGTFNLTDPNTLDYLRRQAGAYITGVSEHTRQMAAQALWEGFSGVGEGKYLAVDGIARYLQHQMNAYQNELTGMSDRRARMIATTEVARAESFGGYIAMLQSGVSRIIWIITRGACLICEGNAGQGSIPILDMFPSGHHAPPAHPLCRCTSAAELPSGGEPDAFDPRDWAWTPDLAQIDRLFSDPSYALWPQQVVDLRRPEFALLDRAQVSLVQWGDLPQAIRDLLTPDALNQIQAQLGNTVVVDDMLQRLQDLIDKRVVKHAPGEMIIPPEPIAGAAEFTLDDILAMTPAADLTAIEQQIQAHAADAVQRFREEMGLE